MKFREFLEWYLWLSVFAAIAGIKIFNDPIIEIGAAGLLLTLGIFLFLIYVRYGIFDDIKDLSVKNAVRCIFYSPDYEKMSEDMDLIASVLDNRVIASPDKVHRYTISCLVRNLRCFILSLNEKNINLPVGKRVKIYKFYRKQKSLLARARKAQKYYAPNLYEEECKKLTVRASGFAADLADILDDPGLGLKSNRDLHECFDWLRKGGYIR